MFLIDPLPFGFPFHQLKLSIDFRRFRLMLRAFKGRDDVQHLFLHYILSHYITWSNL